MSGAKLVEILCPNGRRHKVKMTPGMTVMEILQQTCNKFGYNSEEYDLKHLKKVLNVNSISRYLNLPNNAKLEMIKLNTPRASGESKVTIAVQLPDGKRQLNEFGTNATLLDVLKYFEQQIKEPIMKPGIVCVYMRNEYKSTRVLETTTLKAMGIVSGRAAIRINYRDELEKSEGGEQSNGPATSEVKTGEDSEPVDKKAKIETVPKELEHQQPSPGNQTTETTTILSTVNVKDAKPNKDNTPTDCTTTSISPSLKRIDTETPAVTSHRSARATMAKENLEPTQLSSAPPRTIFPDNYQPASSSTIFPDVKVGKSLSLGNNGLASRNVQPTNQFADFKFPAKPNEDDIAIDPKAMRKEVVFSMPCDRQAILFLSNTSESTSATNIEDEGEKFFDLTVEDLRKRMQVLKSARKQAEDTMMITKSMKEKKELEKATAFEKVPIRFQFPDNHILQAIFRPLETVNALKEFLKCYLADTFIESGFEIFTTPPRCVLKDKSQTLYKAKLCPAAIIHVSSGSFKGCLLKQEHLNAIRTQEEAQNKLESALKKT